MELLPIITQVLMALGAIFLIVLIISFLISKFRKEKEEVITESYPAERYQYFSNSDSNLQSPDQLQEYYYVTENFNSDRTFFTQVRNEQSPMNYQHQIIENQINSYNEPESYQSQWIDFEEDAYFQNPLRKTSSFNFGAEIGTTINQDGRMAIVNNEPLFKYGWE